MYATTNGVISNDDDVQVLNYRFNNVVLTWYKIFVGKRLSNSP